MGKEGSRDALAATLRKFADRLANGADPHEDDDPDEDEDARPVPKGKCFFCNLVGSILDVDDEDDLDEDLVHRQLARACAYGVEVLAQPEASIYLCNPCDKDLKRECRRARADLKAAEEAKPRARRRAT